MNKYNYLNKCNGSIDNYNIEELTDDEKTKFKTSFSNTIKKRKRNHQKKYLTAAILTLALLFGTYSFTANANIPEVTDLSNPYFEKISAVDSNALSKFLGLHYNTDISKYRNTINELSYSTNIGVCLNEVIVDYSQVILVTTFNYENSDLKNKENIIPDEMSLDIKINGDTIEKTRLLCLLENSPPWDMSYKTDENTYTYYFAIPLTPNKYNGNLNLDITINNLKDKNYSTRIANGPWKFKTTVNNSSIIEDSKIYSDPTIIDFNKLDPIIPNIEVNNLKIKEVIVSPISTLVVQDPGVFYSLYSQDKISSSTCGTLYTTQFQQVPIDETTFKLWPGTTIDDETEVNLNDCPTLILK